MSYVDRVRIAKGGKLFVELWDKKQRKDIDISNKLYDHLFNVCYLEDNVVLRDILLLVRDWCDILSPITTGSPNWLKELVDEGLNKPFKVNENGDDNIDTLELSWGAELRQYKGEPKQIEQWVSFDGLGDPPKNDTSGLYKDWPIGQKVNYAIDFCSIDSLSEIPVKLNCNMKMYDEINRGSSPKVVIEGEKCFTLIDILRGIFWELSFHGGPSSRDERVSELNKSIEDIESDNAKTYSLDELDAKLARDEDETKS